MKIAPNRFEKIYEAMIFNNTFITHITVYYTYYYTYLYLYILFIYTIYIINYYFIKLSNLKRSNLYTYIFHKKHRKNQVYAHYTPHLQRFLIRRFQAIVDIFKRNLKQQTQGELSC